MHYLQESQIVLFLVQLFVLMACAFGNEIVERAMAREKEFGTAIGSGVAVPHARMDGLKNPIIAFGRSRAGIEWDAPDGAPVEHVFLLATPTGTEDFHVQTLAAIASSMTPMENRLRIGRAPDSPALCNILHTLLVGKKSGLKSFMAEAIKHKQEKQ